ncbi:endonuclease V [Stackebrandtia albiflava]|uniref:Endonuclease V n=1 Tax=Stackebrandtia albiflava TaxID=406432 RepID=A0A562VDP5_9ACTN|nr:endonuclease V [Stackebrandtia albiflava]TWJ16004.1 endonuclease V [Stackebrandtia albiflava]
MTGSIADTVPVDAAHAERLQLRWRELVAPGEGRLAPETATGVDIGYHPASDRLVAAAVTIRLTDLSTVETAVTSGRAEFDYSPGLLGFREVPVLVRLLDRLRHRPEVLVCDGHGIAHPRRFGMASHLGVATGIPSIGVAKNPPAFHVGEPGPTRGDRTEMRHDAEVVGHVLRTRTAVKPVYVSPGHRIGLDESCELVLALTPAFRLPETTRRSDRLGRDTLRRLDTT